MTNYAWTLTTIGILAGLGMIAAVTLYLYGSHDQAATVIGLAFAFLTPTLTSLLALAKLNNTNNAVHELHLAVNSRLDQLLAATHAVGLSEGRKQRDDEEKSPC